MQTVGLDVWLWLWLFQASIRSVSEHVSEYHIKTLELYGGI